MAGVVVEVVGVVVVVDPAKTMSISYRRADAMRRTVEMSWSATSRRLLNTVAEYIRRRNHEAVLSVGCTNS